MNVIEKFKLDQRKVLITGGAGLLGKRHIEAVVEAGGIPIAVDINEKALDAIDIKDAAGRKIKTFRADITIEKDLIDLKNEIFKTYGAYPEVLINNAAIDPKFQKDSKINLSRLENFSLEQWNHEVSVGLTGAMLCCKHFGTEMARAGRGVIVNVASDLAIIAPNQKLYSAPGVPGDMQNVKPVTYSVIKHGLIGLTRYISTYWADRGVRCNAIAPGGFYNNHSEEFVQKLSSLIPMGRMADLEEIKAAILFLCSDASSYINGTTLIMDGGRSVW